MTDDDRRQDEEIRLLWDDSAEKTEAIARIRNDYAVLSTIVVGKDGQNGIKGELKALREEAKDMKCPTAKMFLEHKEDHEKEKEAVMTAQRFDKKMRNVYIGFAISITVMIIDKFPALIAMLKNP